MSDQLPMAVKVEELKDALSAGNGGISHNNNNGSVRFDSGSGGGGGGGGAVTDLDDADGSGKRAAQEDITALLENIVVDDPSAASSKRETILSNTSGKDIALPLGMMLKAKGTAGENRSLYGSTSSARGKQEPALDSFL